MLHSNCVAICTLVLLSLGQNSDALGGVMEGIRDYHNPYMSSANRDQGRRTSLGIIDGIIDEGPAERYSGPPAASWNEMSNHIAGDYSTRAYGDYYPAHGHHQSIEPPKPPMEETRAKLIAGLQSRDPKTLGEISAQINGLQAEDCGSRRATILYDLNLIAEAKGDKVQPELRQLIQRAASQFAGACLQKLSSSQWAPFKHVLMRRHIYDEANRFHEMMSRTFRGGIKANDLSLYEKFGQAIRQMAADRRLSVESTVLRLGKLCDELNVLFKNIGGSPPDGSMPLKIWNFHLLMTIWADVEQVEKKSRRFVQQLEPEARKLLVAVEFGGVEAATQKLNLSQLEVRRKLASICEPVGQRDLATISMIQLIEHKNKDKKLRDAVRLAAACRQTN